ncbi:D-alanyl-D-alanine carboxypeptidase family protein [Erythrobacter sp. JK5]|uniref:D-alanyl-D-alanine carboxypeptidase family protein n=1 Tax=Erythrobacter sp. JK5 TaxID=2829500 RepID=UPI002011502F|nr:D-alanyl-D-alanine carboxypeptidase family protein [Erythrobacter sp. JK5]
MAAQKNPAAVLPPEDQAPIALLVDISSGQILHERNADRRFVPASITKAMTIFLAFELMEEGRLDPRQTFSVRPETWREWNGKGSTMWIAPENPVRVADLLTGIATVSANDASIVLAEGAAGSVAAWTELMNAKARELGMTNSHFATPNGWPDEGRTFTTARDLVRLAEAMVARHPKKFAQYVGRPEFLWNGISQPNHDPMIGRVKGADGIKTGFTNEAGHGFLGTARRGNQRLVMVLAAADGYGSRARNSRSYIEWGFSAFERRRLFAQGQQVGFARVQDGSARSIALVTDRPVYVNVPQRRSAELAMAIRYDGPLRAPFEAGDRVAILEVTVPGMEPARIPLMARHSIERAGPFARLWNGIAEWFS